MKPEATNTAIDQNFTAEAFFENLPNDPDARFFIKRLLLLSRLSLAGYASDNPTPMKERLERHIKLFREKHGEFKTLSPNKFSDKLKQFSEKESKKFWGIIKESIEKESLNYEPLKLLEFLIYLQLSYAQRGKRGNRDTDIQIAFNNIQAECAEVTTLFSDNGKDYIFKQHTENLWRDLIEKWNNHPLKGASIPTAVKIQYSGMFLVFFTIAFVYWEEYNKQVSAGNTNPTSEAIKNLPWLIALPGVSFGLYRAYTKKNTKVISSSKYPALEEIRTTMQPMGFTFEDQSELCLYAVRAELPKAKLSQSKSTINKNAFSFPSEAKKTIEEQPIIRLSFKPPTPYIPPPPVPKIPPPPPSLAVSMHLFHQADKEQKMKETKEVAEKAASIIDLSEALGFTAKYDPNYVYDPQKPEWEDGLQVFKLENLARFENPVLVCIHPGLIELIPKEGNTRKNFLLAIRHACHAAAKKGAYGIKPLSEGRYELKDSGDPRLIGYKQDGVLIEGKKHSIYILNGYKPKHDSAHINWASATPTAVKPFPYD